MITKNKILIVDAQPFSAFRTEEFFKGESSFAITFVKSVEEAFQKIKEESPDIVVLNNFVPRLDGPDICRRIKKQNNLIRIIVQIGFFSDKEMLAALDDSGADLVVVRKESELSSLRQAIEDIMAC